MPDNKNKAQISNIRKFPIILGLIAYISIYMMNVYFGKSIIFSSLEELSLIVTIFLTLTVVFSEINSLRHKLRDKIIAREYSSDLKESSATGEKALPTKRFVKTKALFTKLFSILNVFKTIKTFSKTTKERQDQAPTVEAAESGIPSVHSDDLVEIHKEDRFLKHDQKGKKSAANKGEIALSILYIVSFIILAFWYLRRMPMIMPFSYNETYSYGIINAILLLIFPCVATIYLKMRKDDGAYHGDKTSHDALMLLSSVLLVYSVVIATSSVLRISFLVILQWLFYTVSVYLFIALAVNIIISALKRKILGSFDYVLFPRTFKFYGKSDSFLDSEDIKLSFSLKSLWTIRYTLRIFPGLILSVIFVLFLSTTMYVVLPHQQAAVYRFGKLSNTSITEEGLYFKLPWPVDMVDIYDVHRVKSMQIGYVSGNSRNFLWGRVHDGGEYLLLLGNGNEMVATNIKIVYKISDLYSYIKTCRNPEEVLSSGVYAALMDRTINTTLDAFLSVDRELLSVSLSEELSEFCKSENLGLAVVEVIVESIHPPVSVANVYQSVVTASVMKNTAITNAQTEAEKRLINAEQHRKTVVNNSISEQHRRVSSARNEMAVYFAAMEAYRISPESFRLSKFLDTYETIIKGNKVYVLSPGTEDDTMQFIISKNRNLLPLIRK